MNTFIYGHRGSKGTHPENTLLGFQQAIECGADSLEIDVHQTKDGELVVIHDDTLERTTDGSGSIGQKTWEEIRLCSAGSCFADLPAYTPSWDMERVPTLRQVLEFLAPYPVELNIELKTYATAYSGIEERVLETVEQYGKGRKIMFSSFHLPTLIRLRERQPSAETAWLLHTPISQPGDYIHTFGFEALHISKEVFFSNEAVFSPHAHQLRVWTVNNPKEIEKLVRAGVRAVITDFPERALAIRNGHTAVR